MREYDICIIGGGASGMMAAITAARYNENARIAIIEKNDIPGRKLLATGNGRCNITNTSAEQAAGIMKFMSSIGITTRTEDEGRVYPYSGQASQVLRCFRNELDNLGINLLLNETVKSITKPSDFFVISMEAGDDVRCDELIIAAGGKAGPEFGTIGDGYKFAREFGHNVTKLAPALTSVKLADYDSNLKGIRAKGIASLKKDGEVLASEAGEIQFTADGLSGICVMNLSRLLKLEEGEKPEEGFARYEIMLDLMPDMEEESLAAILSIRRDLGLDGLVTLVDDRLADIVRARDKDNPAKIIKNMTFQVSGAGGWKNAQVTSGGVPLEEIKKFTCESTIVDGLYFAGEVLDYDGPCGGYNLNFAWLTGIRAGRAAAMQV